MIIYILEIVHHPAHILYLNLYNKYLLSKLKDNISMEAQNNRYLLQFLIIDDRSRSMLLKIHMNNVFILDSGEYLVYTYSNVIGGKLYSKMKSGDLLFYISIYPGSSADYAYWVTYYSTKVCWYATMRRKYIHELIYYAQSIGGGWGSVANPEKAIVWAYQLYSLGKYINDYCIMRKCRVYMGYAYCWTKQFKTAENIFNYERQIGIENNDLVHFRRCQAALLYLKSKVNLNRV